MVFKLIFTIALLVAVAIFTGFNLGNKCDIWLFGKQFNQVPVFITIAISFAAGILAALPAVFLRGEKKMTPEQARALAERLEQNEKKQLEKQLNRQKRLEEAKAKAQAAFEKKPKKDGKDAQSSVPQENK
ncbi:MAG: hypothetical protein J6V90_04115 [Treponema sp.]|nr:hypothetical protein [Treponema sp.]